MRLVCSGLPARSAYSALIEVTEGARAAAGCEPDETAQRTGGKKLFHVIHSRAKAAASDLGDFFIVFVVCTFFVCLFILLKKKHKQPNIDVSLGGIRPKLGKTFFPSVFN